MGTYGGKRPGAGRPKGTNNPRTLEKIRLRKYMEQRIMKATSKILSAQILIATGQTFLYKIEKKRIEGPKGGISYQNLPPKLVTATYEIEEYLSGITPEGDAQDENDPSAAYYYLTTKEPNNEAIKNLFDRVHGKPKESVAVEGNVTFSLLGLAKRRDALKAGTVVEAIEAPQQPESHE